MATHKILFLLCLLIHFVSSCFASNSPSAYEMLENFNFPKGILPDGTKSYILKPDGRFEVELSGDCDFQVNGGYLLKYKRNITGRVDSGVLKELNGVSVKVLFLWFGIGEVVRSGSTLYFHVGPLSASFPVENFEECPQCRCGVGANAGLSVDS